MAVGNACTRRFGTDGVEGDRYPEIAKPSQASSCRNAPQRRNNLRVIGEKSQALPFANETGSSSLVSVSGTSHLNSYPYTVDAFLFLQRFPAFSTQSLRFFWAHGGVSPMLIRSQPRQEVQAVLRVDHAELSGVTDWGFSPGRDASRHAPQLHALRANRSKNRAQ
jgi:hypothetical protein